MALTSQNAQADPAARRSLAGRIAPIAILALGLGLFLVLGGREVLSFDTLTENRQALLAWVDRNPILTPLGFFLCYALAVAFSIPAGAVLTFAGGFMFGTLLGTVLSTLAATVGATILFVAARTALGNRLRGRVEGGLRRMDAGFRENAFNYLLFLRLVPVFPFWLVNIAPAFADIPLRTYVAATALGIVPGTFVFSLVGNGLGVLIDAGEKPDLGILFRIEVLAPILGLALLALVPVLYKRRTRKRR